MKASHLILLLAMNFCWAAIYAAYKVIGPALETGGIVTLRFGLAAVIFLFLWPWLPGPTPKGKDFVISCAMGLVLFVIGQRLQVYGNYLGTAGNSSVLMALEPLVTSVIAAMFLRERIGPRRAAGFGMGLLGVGLLHGVYRSDFQWTSMASSLIFVSSFICEAAYTVMGKPLVVRGVSLMRMLALGLFSGTLINLLIDGRTTLSAATHLPGKAWVLLFALAIICTVIGYSVWFIVIRECPVNVAALTVFAQAVFGVIIAAVCLQEPLHWGHLTGSIAIALGLALGLSGPAGENPSPPSPAPANGSASGRPE
ncbi:MAG: DMT family transporter [Verrucomicrobia bacterium]|nr:DMT family transporter [Verrucomicrobiota bacterium]